MNPEQLDAIRERVKTARGRTPNHPQMDIMETIVILGDIEILLAEVERLTHELDQARAVAREMAVHDRNRKNDYCQFLCGGRAHDGLYHPDHTSDCPVSKVRAWDDPKPE